MGKKVNRKQTKIKHRFGAFEVRISDDKVEIEDYINRQRKYVFSNTTFEYHLFLSFLSETKRTEDGYVAKTAEEVKGDLKSVEYMTYILYSTQNLFTNAKFREKYTEMMMGLLNVEASEEDESEEEILENLKAEYEAKEVLDREVQDKVQD
jgi:arginine/lysine/ornithine decarboxylase